ncbi:hypothetical protein DIPPA_22780 [Diplonema papillatum]|nr:hypothetical protein DIPPA_22780 [Diplonema papillatum]
MSGAPKMLAFASLRAERAAPSTEWSLLERPPASAAYGAGCCQGRVSPGDGRGWSLLCSVAAADGWSLLCSVAAAGGWSLLCSVAAAGGWRGVPHGCAGASCLAGFSGFRGAAAAGARRLPLPEPAARGLAAGCFASAGWADSALGG